MQPTAIVTGSSSGVGTETVRALAARGMTVVLACRNLDKGHGVASTMTGDVRVRRLDLADLASIRRFVEDLDDDGDLDRIDVLVNNAGVMGGPLGYTVDGFEVQIGTNHLGHFALTGLLLPRLLSTPAARVVNVTSIAAAGARLVAGSLEAQLRDPHPYEPMQVYSNSKLANQLFTVELERRAKAAGAPLRSLAAHPGVSATGLFTVHQRKQGRRLLPWFIDHAQSVVFQSAARGAACSVLAATDPSLQGGELIGPRLFRQSRGRPTSLPMQPAALDPSLADELWKLSSRWTGVEPAFPR